MKAVGTVYSKRYKKDFYMKNKIKFPGIVALAAIIMVSTVFASCSDPSISGTFSYNDNSSFTIVFEGKYFVGKWKGNDIAGTFSVIDDKIILDNFVINDYVGDKIVFTNIDNDTLLDPDGDIWNKRR